MDLNLSGDLQKVLEKYLEKSDEKSEDRKQVIEKWKHYRDKILNGDFTLDDYTNTMDNGNNNPGSYLFNFIQRHTSVFGSSRCGNENHCGIIKKSEKSYFIQKDSVNKIDEKDNASYEEAEIIFNKYLKPFLKKLIELSVSLREKKEQDDIENTIREIDTLIETGEHEKNYFYKYSARQILRKMVVLDNLDKFIHIYKDDALNYLYKNLIAGDNQVNEDTFLLKNYKLCQKLIEFLKKMPELKEISQTVQNISGFLWDYYSAENLINDDCPNIIFYGAPGTGKNYHVEKIKDFITMVGGIYKQVQFHPSFTYEDFIEGFKPAGISDNGNIKFEMVNGVFKEFCIQANNNREKNYYFIVDEINRANLSTVFGEALSLLEKDYRHESNSDKNLIETQYSSLIGKLISENEGQYENLAYKYEKNDETISVKFGIPNNVYFIGMMNDVDKSIDTFDLALRRRFKWIRKECDYGVIAGIMNEKKGVYSNIDNYCNACEKLNKYISEALNLGKSYEFGHSFFMKITTIAKKEEIKNEDMKKLFNEYLSPTLKEYLRAYFSEKEIETKLKEALKIFSL
jgi:hypothetical protein